MAFVAAAVERAMTYQQVNPTRGRPHVDVCPPRPTPVETSPADEPGSVVDRQGKLYVDGEA